MSSRYSSSTYMASMEICSRTVFTFDHLDRLLSSCGSTERTIVHSCCADEQVDRDPEATRTENLSAPSVDEHFKKLAAYSYIPR